jgi:membrane protease YdiL (CAAX protease family)
LDFLVIIFALCIALSVTYGLVYWAYRAETDRSARVGLSLVYGIPGVLLLVAGLAVTVYGGDVGPVMLATGLGLSLPLVPSFRVAISRYVPIDPASPVDMSGLCVFLGVLGLLITTTLNAPAPEKVSSPVDYGQLIGTMLSFVSLAYAIVGLGLRRSLSEANERLGLRRPTMQVVGIACGALVLALVINGLAGGLTAIFQKETSDQINQSLQEMTNDVQNPLGAIMIGVMSAVGEECFFRGALQPKFGIVLTSLVFALLHTQYGFSFVTLGVLGMGIIFGLLRRRYGTVAPMITHCLVNVIAVLALTYR